MASPSELDAMRRALALSHAAVGTTSPNPPVGSVILDATGTVIGEGWTQPPGGAHAEIVALAQAGAGASGGVAVVTLEPCPHIGQTGPCTDALINAGIRRVVYACEDPNPQAAGGGGVLRAAGLDVEGGVLARDVEDEVLGPWLFATRHGRPFVTWKYGGSLDGRVAAPDGSSRWVTGPDARRDAHRLRRECDAVLVGIGTVLTDDPRLTARDDDDRPTGRQPLRVVLDTTARTPHDAAVLDDTAPTLVLNGTDLPTIDGHLDLAAVLGVLHDRGIVSVLLEGGPTLAMSFLRADLIDRVVAYVAPVLIGGGGLPALGGEGAPSIDKAWRLHIEQVSRVGTDLRIVARPARAED
ncbi:MAG: diaminohydroxyphosphoribosylaminopyrimidine deaminase [Frankiales bacterium]|nr:diaminohydroxyphosphoribosylaminopyrimidine deaminase [Frankiales bacterium]